MNRQSVLAKYGNDLLAETTSNFLLDKKSFFENRLYLAFVGELAVPFHNNPFLSVHFHVDELISASA